MQSPQYAPNDSTRVGADRSVGRGRVLSQSLLVARERRRRELGSNLVIDTIALTSGEGHVVEVGISRRVRKILAGVPASVVIRDHILALSFSRSKRQHWTVGNRPIRYYDLRSLRRNSAEAQIQDRSRQKTGLNTAPGFSRVYPSFPQAPVIPADAGTQEKTKHTASPLRFAKGDASAASRGMHENHHHRHNRRSTHSHNNVSPGPRATTPPPSEGEIKRGLPVRAQGGAGPTTTQTTTPQQPLDPQLGTNLIQHPPTSCPPTQIPHNPTSKPITYHSNHTSHDPANYP